MPTKSATPKVIKEKKVQNPKGGRPSKMATWIWAFEKVLNDPTNVLMCTDEELVMLTNELLEEKDQICENTFIWWKAGNITEEYKETYTKFLGLYKKALSKEKKSLMVRFQSDEGQWQKWAWIIERKFDEWNIRIKTDNKNENTNKNLNVNWSLKDKSDEELTNLLLKALK